ncbi:hypothetical protein ASPZODRAFT_149077 [Penicilliopsis zonata CBS 506.65]|uniref:Mob1/phocein n=1 Tax=Penicilliopsis zonata CBS 506.65 TaxID=1073090 RepID=A0A1L9SR30_9EURO|nr:hypothetical protein ASPZODRAFT_149077 [Penicilliopsis zonata CBS 506.65]OJJ49554.1 hypothetical protein ASPZODRAFT_149077 [Penicilliopsis zonata CBS 506.65]
MANFLQSVRQGFGRGNNNKNNAPKMNNGSPAQSPAPQAPPMPMSPSFASSLSVDSAGVSDADAPKYFFQEKYAPLNVKGNFLTLCACPKNVELGEWLAHQIVEQYRLLHGMLQVIQETNSVTGFPICNESTCPTMSAGRLTYTWLVDGRAAKISAPKFINRVEKWIVSKIHDPVMFPTGEVHGVPETFALNAALNPDGHSSANSSAEPSTDEWIGKSSGFPPTFYKDCQGIMKQMFRCYAHLYHAHWLNPFWHINKHDILNMCFVHFVTVAKYYKLVSDKEMEPMQPLIDLFIKQQRIPAEALSGGHWAQQTPSSA